MAEHMEQGSGTFFSDDELQYIKQLPVRKVRTGGIICMAKYDEVSGCIYLLDDHGTPTGEVRVLNAEARAAHGHQPSIKPAPNGDKERKKSGGFPGFLTSRKKKDKTLGQEEPEAGMRKADSSRVGCDNDDNEASPDEKADSSRTWLYKVLVAFGAIVIAVNLCLLILPRVLFPGATNEDGIPASEQQFEVIQLRQDVLPGQQITEQMLSKVSVNGETYNQAAMAGNTYYAWSKAADVVGLYASGYLASGQCLAFHQVVGMYEPESNPYLMLSDGYDYIDIPVNLSYQYVDSVMIGRYLDLTIEIQTQSNRTEKVDTPDVPGLDHSSSITAQTVTDTYKLKDVVVLDMIAADGSSLFDTISTYNKIPDGSLHDALETQVRAMLSSGNDKNAAQALSKFYVVTLRLQLPKEQVKAIGKLNGENTKTTISGISDNYLTDTAARSNYIAEARFTLDMLGSVLDELVGR